MGRIRCSLLLASFQILIKALSHGLFLSQVLSDTVTVNGKSCHMAAEEIVTGSTSSEVDHDICIVAKRREP